MSRGLLFWLLMILALVFGVWSYYPNVAPLGMTLFTFILLSLLGWQVFGPPLRG